MTSEINTPISILIVDDSMDKINKVKIALKKKYPNYSVSIAQDQISAQQKLEVEKHDLLLLDMQLPLRIDKGEPLENGGESLLDELDFGDNYIQPSRIVAFTEYEHLQDNVREKYPELGAIKFDATSNKWEIALFRILKSISKSKLNSKKIIYCEGNNVNSYNKIPLSGIEFWALKDSRAIYFSAKNESDKYALRDRDFLTTNEIKTLTNKPYFDNYFILHYYCFENYLYHPDNISEVVKEFNKQEYINELTSQKNDKLDSIIQDYKLSRNGYTDFTDNEKKNMDSNPENEIVTSLKSNDFEKFYKFFDMAGKKDKENKKSFNKNYLAKLNLSEDRLVRTKWFKNHMEVLFSKLL
jgi:CheY-like chemotaxis protein